MNRWIGYGNVGGDPVIRNLESGKKVAKFSLATNKTYTNQQGEKITDTQWHNILYWNKLAELCEKYVKKGNSLIIEGEITYRSYENKDGQTIYITEIIGKELHFAGNTKTESKPEAKSEPKSGKQYTPSKSNINDLPGNVADYDEIPVDDNPPF